MSKELLDKYNSICDEIYDQRLFTPGDKDAMKLRKIVKAVAAFIATDYKATILDLVTITGLSKSSIQRYLNEEKIISELFNTEIASKVKQGLENNKVNARIKGGLNSYRNNVAVKDYDGSYRLITGNENGVMLTNYILSCKKENGTLPEKPVVVKTIVTTKLINKLCEKYGCELKNVLTGFKYIGEVILGLEQNNEENRYLFGFEESYGYLSGTYVRDKDAVVAAMLVCEMAAYYKKQGKSLAQVIDGLYDEFGYYLNKTYSFEFEGAAGMQKMADIMASVRENMPTAIDNYKVVKVSDYKLSKETDILTGETTEITLPQSNVIALNLDGDNAVIIRPSGTEPKIKLYITAVGKDKDNADEVCNKLVKASKELLGIE